MALLSYSSCTIYNECPQRYKWSRIDHLPPLRGRDDLTAVVPGTVAHNAAEKALMHNPPDFSSFDHDRIKRHALEMNAQENVSIESRWGTIEAGMDYIFECSDSLRMFLQGENLAEKKYLSEWWFGDVKNPLPLTDSCFIQGACDLILFYDIPGTAVIYDYKASRTEKYLHREQLYTYALAAGLRTGYTVHMAFFYLMPIKKQVCVTVSPHDIERTRNMYISASDRIDSGMFDPSPSEGSCRFCEYYPCPECGMHL